MGSLLCKQKIGDDTIDITQEITDTDIHDECQLLKTENNKRTKISRTSSIKVVMGRKIAETGETEAVNNNRDEAPLLEAVEDISNQQREIDDNLDETSTVDKHSDHSFKEKLQTDVEKTTSDNSSGYQSHTELTSLELLLPNEILATDETGETTIARRIVRRHQSLPADISTRRHGSAIRDRFLSPGTSNKMDGEHVEEKNNEPQIIKIDEYQYSTSNPKNRPKAAHGIRSRLNSFNFGLKRNSQTVADTHRPKKSKSFLTKDVGSNEDPKFSSNAECDFSDIKIYIKRLEAETKRINYSDTRFKYKASIAINDAMPSNENSSGKLKALQRGRVVFKDCKVRLNISDRSNICEISLPRCILDMKRAECEESETDEVSCV